jgi:hypothetical protein
LLSQGFRLFLQMKIGTNENYLIQVLLRNTICVL